MRAHSLFMMTLTLLLGSTANNLAAVEADDRLQPTALIPAPSTSPTARSIRPAAPSIRPVTPSPRSVVPELQFAKTYTNNAPIILSQYWVSEKFDGVRAYWDGQSLRTRSGRTIHPPGWFTADFPDTSLDGELWLGRQRFAELSGRVRRLQPKDSDWRDIHYRVFDLPKHPGSFDQRLKSMQSLRKMNISWLKPAHQWRVADQAALLKQLQAYVEDGAEGLILHRGGAYHRVGRSDNVLKLKPLSDAEAYVLQHLPGKGKYQGMMGSILVEQEDGQRFKIGSGFSDQQRRTPPPIGSRITYQYTGYTASGLPRFARFLRLRPEQ